MGSFLCFSWFVWVFHSSSKLTDLICSLRLAGKVIIFNGKYIFIHCPCFFQPAIQGMCRKPLTEMFPCCWNSPFVKTITFCSINNDNCLCNLNKSDFSNSEIHHFATQTPSPSFSKRRGQVTQRGFGDPAKDRHHLPLGLRHWHFGSAKMGQQTNKQPKKVGGKVWKGYLKHHQPV